MYTESLRALATRGFFVMEAATIRVVTNPITYRLRKRSAIDSSASTASGIVKTKITVSKNMRISFLSGWVGLSF
ncbi:hypothetical protein FHW16_005415 [Phyllobacterium myrsinacearum]|uniref:Uncharacterized protein n=1 Tax=Phyllobacterium myrsinacearum TaxID=28101 RepID=A0A839EYX1_9HYPH|nr:hypothetical protein [Phyllobacterium myrsinacearum]